MVWRLARGAKMDARGNWNDLTDQLMDEVMRGQIASTYQKDYLGIPQGKEGEFVRLINITLQTYKATFTPYLVP